MTTPDPEVRELAAEAMYELGDPTGEGIPWDEQDADVRRVYLRRTDAVLTVADPVIRRDALIQARDRILAEASAVNWAKTFRGGLEHAANIIVDDAILHAQHPTEEKP